MSVIREAADKIGFFDQSPIDRPENMTPSAALNALGLGAGIDEGTFNARLQSGFYYGSPISTAGTILTVVNRLYLTPILIHTAVSIDRIRAEVATSSAGSVVRLGIYSTNATGLPGTLIVDGGTISGATVAVAEVTVDVTLSPGLHWLAAAAQSGTPTLRSIATGAGEMTPNTGTPSAINQIGLYGTAAGAFASDPAITASATTPPRVLIRAT